MRVPNKVRSLREAHSLTQEAVANRAGINLSHLRRIESGQTPDPRLGTARRVARALHSHVDAVFPESDRL